MLAIIRGGPWEFKSASEPDQKSQLFNFSQGREKLENYHENHLPSFKLAKDMQNWVECEEYKLEEEEDQGWA